MGKTIHSNDGLFFEWDEEKDRINIEKHGISFQMAIEVFKDPNRQEYFDACHSTEEELRFLTLGRLFDGTSVVIVVSTDRGNRTRIISARYSTKKEEMLYYEEC